VKQSNQDTSFKYQIHSVKSAFTIIEILARDKIEYSISDLMKESHLSKGTVYRLLCTLRSLGYIAHNQDSHKYYLTYKFSKIGITMNERSHILEIVPHMKKLARHFKEMVNLAILDQGKVIYLHSIGSPHALKLDFKVGTHQPVHCTALGRSLLAYQSSDVINKFLKTSKLKPYTPNTITDPDKLLLVLQKVREQGYSFVSEEYRPGVCCIAAPIFDEKQNIAASLSISLPTARMNSDLLRRMIRFLKGTVNRIRLAQFIRA